MLGGKPAVNRMRNRTGNLRNLVDMLSTEFVREPDDAKIFKMCLAELVEMKSVE